MIQHWQTLLKMRGADVSKPKRYFQLVHEGKDGTKTYRIHGIRRCAITGRYITSGERCNHDTQTNQKVHGA